MHPLVGLNRDQTGPPVVEPIGPIPGSRFHLETGSDRKSITPIKKVVFLEGNFHKGENWSFRNLDAKLIWWII